VQLCQGIEHSSGIFGATWIGFIMSNHPAVCWQRKCNNKMEMVRTEIAGQILFVWILFAVCCKAPAWKPAQPINSPIYSGLWKDIKIQLPPDATLRRCSNCEVMLRDTFWQLRPLSVGRCSIEFNTKEGDTPFYYYWDVIQVPDPFIKIGPMQPNYDPKDKENLFLNPNLLQLGDKIYTMPGELYSYRKFSSYEIFSFYIKIYDEKNTLIYSGENLDKVFSCDNADAYFKYNKKGNRLIIEDIIVFFPDKTNKKISMDTIFFK
jgi:hypothetical protein